ncbi:hypothetical protein LSH36_143g04009 [Paralvinella palmiformis]|uniref:Calcineurin-like phosphoesterase domain-containing protein n=1 Tax=Paralvinella palmiformis TaxID=53620 RepID=A0AAD9JV02_9ANNE|nr:hypothetical protein LSH36_143g04009 [Paralvinella palmiformis]
MYNLTNIKGLNWWISLGNHDYGLGLGEEWVQVELDKVELLWNLPHLWYDFVKSDGEVSVHFIMLDTEAHGQRVRHDHNMQHLQKIDDPGYFDFLISGGGGSELFDEEPTYSDILRDQYDIELKLMEVVGAFAAVEATANSLNVTFVDLNTSTIYSYIRTKSARRNP